MKWSVMSPLRIVVLDDHALIRHALSLRLGIEADFKVVGVCASSQELMAALQNEEVDVLVLDYQLGQKELDGQGLIRLLNIRYPQVRILISSSAESPATVKLAIRAGARGFVGKSQETDELVAAIRTVAAERIYLSALMAAELDKLPSPEEDPSVTDIAPTAGAPLLNDSSLSPREQEVLRCCLDGMSVSQIAEKFSRSRKTISGQKQAAFRKLGVRTDSELFKLGRQLDGDSFLSCKSDLDRGRPGGTHRR